VQPRAAPGVSARGVGRPEQAGAQKVNDGTARRVIYFNDKELLGYA